MLEDGRGPFTMWEAVRLCVHPRGATADFYLSNRSSWQIFAETALDHIQLCSGCGVPEKQWHPGEW